MKTEETRWLPPKRAIFPQKSQTRQVIDALLPGQCLRIVHDDISCSYPSKTPCSLKLMLSKKRREGWEIESYHEGQHIAVVRRMK